MQCRSLPVQALTEPHAPLLCPGFDPYLDGLQQNAYILDERGDPYIGWVSPIDLAPQPASLPRARKLLVLLSKAAPPFPAPQVWPGGCHFPDFGFNPAVDAYWLAQLDIYNGYAQWDGLWIDMNESEYSVWGVAAVGWKGSCLLGCEQAYCTGTRYMVVHSPPGSWHCTLSLYSLTPCPAVLPAVANFCTGNVCHMPTAGGRLQTAHTLPLTQPSTNGVDCAHSSCPVTIDVLTMPLQRRWPTNAASRRSSASCCATIPSPRGSAMPTWRWSARPTRLPTA